MSDTTGGWTCSICGTYVTGQAIHVCGGSRGLSNIPQYPPPTGWLCPKCGRSNAPFVMTCQCGPNVTVSPSYGGTDG